MSIEYRDSQDFRPDDLQELFLSVQWQSGNHSEKLAAAMKNSGSVFSAWDNGKLIGLINALDDGAMTAYVHYLLVNPEYQGNGVGRQLLQMIKEKYKDYLRIVLISDASQVGFYQKQAFCADKDAAAMFLDSF